MIDTYTDEPFTFTTASVTSKGVITSATGEGQRRIFALGTLSLEMVQILAGNFLMGSPSGEQERSDTEGPQHQVMFDQSFYLGRYPITQAQWRWAAKLPPVTQTLSTPPQESKGSNYPVVCVSWRDAQEFCHRLSRELSQNFRLPSEAEWEYACRAGTTTPFSFGEILTPMLANYHGHYVYGGGPTGAYRGETTEVGQFPANSWGLHDMHGNVLEWCEDRRHLHYYGAPTDGTAWGGRHMKGSVLRGGSWLNIPARCRSAYRYAYSRGGRGNNIGFRVVCSVP